MKLSICIPTYNRAEHLINCLKSIQGCDLGKDIQVCVSDNCSTDQTKTVVGNMQKLMPVKYSKNMENIGLARNILQVVDMADGEFVWILGDDDILLPDAVSEVIRLIDAHNEVDYFYINSNHLTTEHVFSFPQPFSLVNLPRKMKPFSPRKNSGEMQFLNMINPYISFDYLGGIFLSVFRRKNWVESKYIINQTHMLDNRLFSNFDNTFPHVKIFSLAFANSKAYFCAKPLSVCLTGAREWSPMYCLIKSVRLVEAVEIYRKNGLSLARYFLCKNSALNSFIPDMIYLVLNRKTSGFEYVNPLSLAARNCLYPNFYLSLLYYVLRRLKRVLLK